MDILFIHGNYPGQFKNLLTAFANNKTHRILFLTEQKSERISTPDGVNVVFYEQPREISKGIHHYLESTEMAVLRGQSVVKALIGISQAGFKPNLVITHGGMGLGLFIKDIIPDCIHIGYFEWYFLKDTSKWLLNRYEIDQQLGTKMRNLNILEELSNCDIGVVPTEWQKRQFPKEYQSKLRIIFDGIDTKFFKPNTEIDKSTIYIKGEDNQEHIEIRPNQKILSYATRGMETLRGFPEFMVAAKQALICYPELHVIIAGRDRRAYSYDSPHESGSWKQFMLDKLGDFEGKKRIIFTGLLTYNDYIALLQRSNLHCYFTRPYVTSWSLFEAAACGASLCVNYNEATKDIIEEESEVSWVDLEKQQEINETVIKAIGRKIKRRAKLKSQFKVDKTLIEWEKTINESIKEKSKRSR